MCVFRFFKKCDPTDVFVPIQRAAPCYGFVAIRNEGDNVTKAMAFDGP